MREFNRQVIEEYRANGGRLSGPLAKSTLLLLTSTGAHSGQPRTAVLGYGLHADSYVVIASNNGATSHPAWYRNLLANPTATVEVGQDRFQVRARTAEPAEREQVGAAVSWLEQQQALTSREIPLVLLERTS
ncbi:MAG: nitroreductase family deazaflavin-dependent oxidoreductase [Candidatus Dormibacteraeota bacterium]|uniref:Nitroreductase family deazaflavin-dependent oxidoreductase n=2 Tax=Candidatus Dormiibacter inghamiae TaxID=3127013 RepID=A0A934NEP6_9BACT|nr:nitroreductase family deazaflavin-dependent oxidoreductase [Candidatus Dormibacteraeota bacterium]MBJ7606587.1 nitroreductase family deazaflavin-dependent oxidoreductase [Candidatus Dormibacteraeota bacterium]